MELKKLKVATSRMAGYTGVLGRVRFKNGMSEEALPRHIRDQMAAAMPFIEVDEDGVERPAGVQNRMVDEARKRAEPLQSLTRQTEAEKAAEIAKSALDSMEKPDLKTREELEAIAEKGGIKGLREIAARWDVKHRSIPTLIEMILESQEKYMLTRAAKAGLVSEQTAGEPETETPAEPGGAVSSEERGGFASVEGSEQPEDTIKAAAASGDLSAAVSAGE